MQVLDIQGCNSANKRSISWITGQNVQKLQTHVLSSIVKTSLPDFGGHRWGHVQILLFSASYIASFLKDTCYGLGKNSPNQQLLDILACNSANRPSFKCEYIFNIYGHLVKKDTFRFFERSSGYEIIEQNVSGGSDS